MTRGYISVPSDLDGVEREASDVPDSPLRHGLHTEAYCRVAPTLSAIIATMAGSARLTLGGFLARFAFAVLVVGATYNPTRYSFYAWAKSTGFEWRPPTVFVAVVLLIGWFICLRLTLRSMGGLGLLLANAFLAALYWLVASWGWLPIENIAVISWLGLFSVAAILAVGMSWTRWRRSRIAPSG
jgi:Family of unknown function (DUF6524)